MNTPRSVRTVQMYGDRRTGMWVVVHCPNGVVPPASLAYGHWSLSALGTPSEVLCEVERWLGARGQYRPLRAIGRVIGKSPRQVSRYLSGEVEPIPGPGWGDIVRLVAALDWEERWSIWRRLTGSSPVLFRERTAL